jgi:hypothetical protein
MSLLTEEQIAELACIASNQSTSKDLYQEFCEWKRLNDHPMWGHNIEYRHIGETK